MKKILVATDFSEVSFNAAIYAAKMAGSIHAELHLLYINQFALPYGEVAILIGPDMDKAKTDLNHFRENLTSIIGNDLVITAEVRLGIFFDELRSVCEDLSPYAVVMGSVGASGGQRLLYGSHAIQTLKHLTWPLIIVPPSAMYKNVRKIGLACDFKDVVDTIPDDEIKTLVADFNAELHVINTGKKNVFDADVVFQSGLFQEMMNNSKPHYHFISSEDVDEGILDFAEKENIDLLVVLPKRHGLLDKLIHRSHAKQFVLHSHVPVMALHEFISGRNN